MLFPCLRGGDVKRRAAIPILVAARLLKPLGNPAQDGIKFFATLELLELVKGRAWLVKVTNAVNQNWQRQKARKKNFLADVPGS
jgi:hypothetical protein